MVKRVLLFAAVLCMLAGGAQSQILFTASLTEGQESPPLTGKAQGTAWVLLSPDMSTLTWRLTFAQMESTVTAAHFHAAPPGVPGGVVHPITISGNGSSGTWSNVPDSILARLFKGELYLNVHTQKHPGGEIRGQLVMAPGPGFTISLDAAQETPPVASGATGTGYAYLDSTGSGLVHRVTIAGLSTALSASHFHAAPAGVPGGVVHGVSFTDSTSTGVWTGLPDSIYGRLLRSGLYFNVHSQTFPGGELRGQVISATGIRFIAALNAAQEVPTNTSKAQGTLWGIINPEGTTMTLRVTYAHLDSTYTASHFHLGAAGVPGPVLVGVPLPGNTLSSAGPVPPDSAVRLILTGNIYFIIHSAKYPGGEIRGQVIVPRAPTFIIGLNGAQEGNPANPGTGTGYGVLDSLGRRLTYRTTVAGLADSITNAHFHLAPPGVNGAVIQGTPFTDSTAAGTWTGFADTMLAAMVKGNLYHNVHTRAKPGGQIRGQMVYAPSTLTSVRQVSAEVPAEFRLEQNYPNPFNPSTVIQFSLTAPGAVSLRVYNVIGQEVATLVNEARPAGTYRVSFNAGSLASGVYFYRLSAAGGRLETRKMMLLR